MIRLPGTLTIAAVGKVRTPHWREAQQDYLDRLDRYADVAMHEVRDAVGRYPDDIAVQREGESLLAAVDGLSWVVVLDPTGRQADSVRFAHYVREKCSVFNQVGFVIGGPLGLSPDILSRADERLSLSRMTLPHELARIVLLEQLYRAATILNGEQYHK
jgi:23S rRNA (pseudouridine1915-N3)-methyltransferase